MIGATVLGKAISIGFQIGDSAIANVSELRIAEYNTASLGGLQCVLGALCNHLAFMLRHGGQDVNRKLVGVRVINSDELNTGVHKRRDESQIARQAIELGDHQLGLLPLANSQRLLKLGALVAFAAFNLGEVAD
jgi:hypothetical protein